MSDQATKQSTSAPRRGPSKKRSRLAWLRPGPLTGKLLVIGVVIGLLSWLLGMVEALVNERETRYREASRSVGDLWGRPQTLSGPVLAIPYGVAGDRPGLEHAEQLGVAYFLPDSLELHVSLTPQIRKRGMFQTVVYTLDAHLAGRFPAPSIEGLDPRLLASEPGLILITEEAFIAVGVSDMRSIGKVVRLHVGDLAADFRPGTRMPAVLANGMSVDVPALGAREGDEGASFEIRLELNGSDRLRMLPLGRETHASVSSTWPSPSFGGAFLPSTHQVHENGFEAEWALSYFGRGYPQVLDSATLPGGIGRQLEKSAFGVDLHQPVTPYRRVQRAIKYGLLFLVFTFGYYFMLEVRGQVRVHPIQYATVGLPMCLFFLLLVAFSEHIGFVSAYLLGACAVIALVVFYSSSVLRSLRSTSWIAALLAGLYGYLYTLLEQESYSLLWGAVGLLVLTAAFMHFTRKVDWYAAYSSRPASAAPAAERA